MAKTEEVIAKFGHTGIQILGSTPAETYTYSIGLQDAGWDELVVTSINPTTGLMMINEVVRRLRELEKRPEAGMKITQALSVPVYLRPVPPHVSRDMFFAAMERANRKGLPNESVTMLQLVWPDDKNKFPWQPGYNEVQFPQRMLEDE
jgi:hypothetical protein